MDLGKLENETRDDLPPAKVNAVTMALTGTLVWVVATIVVAVVQARGAQVPEGWLDVCLAGIGLGAVGLVWGVAHERRTNRGDPR